MDAAGPDGATRGADRMGCTMPGVRYGGCDGGNTTRAFSVGSGNDAGGDVRILGPSGVGMSSSIYHRDAIRVAARRLDPAPGGPLPASRPAAVPGHPDHSGDARRPRHHLHGWRRRRLDAVVDRTRGLGGGRRRCGLRNRRDRPRRSGGWRGRFDRRRGHCSHGTARNSGDSQRRPREHRFTRAGQDTNAPIGPVARVSSRRTRTLSVWRWRCWRSRTRVWCFRPKIIDGLLREPPRDTTQDPITDREHVRVLASRGA